MGLGIQGFIKAAKVCWASYDVYLVLPPTLPCTNVPLLKPDILAQVMATLDLREQTRPHTLQAEMYVALLWIQIAMKYQSVGAPHVPKNKELMGR